MGQLVYQVCYTRYQVSVYLWRLGAVLKHRKVSKYYDKDCRPGVLYGICKVHKAIADLCLSFRPIFYKIGTTAYKITAFLERILSYMTISEFTDIGSFSFTKEIDEQDGILFMDNLDCCFLWTFLLKKSLTFAQNQYIIKVNYCPELLKSHILFLINFYRKIDGVAMGCSPLGPVLANT